jgi:lysophospholipase L1-like esterase
MAVKKRTLYNASMVIAAILLVFPVGATSQQFKFDFGDGPVAQGYVGVTAKTNYTAGNGYGIDSGNVSSVDREGSEALFRDYLTTTDEIFFSIAVPQGNYDVSVIFGDAAETSGTTVKAENRRLLFDRVKTVPNSFVRKAVTIRRMETESIDGSVTMSIKDRERGYFTWDNVLTLRFSGTRPAVCGVEITKIDDARTLFLCGNSTVVDQLTEPWASWGQMIPHFFQSGVAVANYAESGLTSGNFLSMKRLSKLLTEVQPGDYVFVEFGHNDQKSASDAANYPNNLKTFRDQITAKEAKPVFVTPTARQAENDPLTSIGGLAQTMRETAQKLGVSCIDLNQMVIDLKKALGSDTRYIYMYTASDQTHFCEYGAYELARCVMKGLEEQFPSLTSSFKDGYTTFSPSSPDPLDVLVKESPPVGNRRRSSGRAAVPSRFTVSGTNLRIAGQQASLLKLVVYGVDGKKIGIEPFTISGAACVVSSKLLGRLPKGTYILSLIQDGADPESIVYCRI